MAKIRILSVKQINLNTSGFSHVELPQTGFDVSISVDKALEPLIAYKQTREALEMVAEKTYNEFLLETAKRLQKFDMLFAGMLAKGAQEEAVAKQISNLKRAMKKETPKWERLAEKEVATELQALVKKQR